MLNENKSMTKADIISELAKRTGLSNADVRKVIEEFMQLIKEALMSGFIVQLRGFGTFYRKKRASKKARNINKGTFIEVPAHEVPAYKPGKDFVEIIRNS